MEHNFTGKIVLVVDDNPVNLELLIDSLGDEGLEVAIARSGEKALDIVGAVKPDIILLDVLMPGIDGFETCRRLKQNEATRDIPVIFMTALTETVQKVKGFEASGVDYITKPFQIEEVLARIHTHLMIRSLQHQLQEEIHTKDKFFSIMAHDLKSPLVGFLSFTNVLNDARSMEPEQFERLVQQFTESAERLFALLENLLTWSRLQRGMFEYNPGAFYFDDLAARTIALLTPNAGHKQITIRSVCPHVPVRADLDMLDTVVRNLLSNAVKFTKPGGTVEIAATHDDAMVTVTVSDTGIGISDAKLQGLFRLDVRTQRDGTAGEKGTGLGLFLCKEFVEKHGGTLWVESEVGTGTTFNFTVPKANAC